jgi:hypothetical protein
MKPHKSLAAPRPPVLYSGLFVAPGRGRRGFDKLFMSGCRFEREIMKRKLTRLLFLFLLCISCQSQRKQNVENAEEAKRPERAEKVEKAESAKAPTSRKSSGGFGAHLILADRPQAFVQEWRDPLSGKPQLWSATEAKRGEPLAAFIMFAGCLPDDSGICNAEVDFRIYKPDTSLYAERAGLELWKKAAPPATNTQLSTANMVIRLQPDDPAGEYKVRASVRDLNRNVNIEVEEKFKVQ